MKDRPYLVVEHASGQYPVYVGFNWLEELAALAAGWIPSRAIVVTDENVEEICGRRWHHGLVAAGREVITLTIPAGEASKSLDQAKGLYQQLHGLGADRQSVVIALGGGVVGDLAGFVAATWMRGVPLIQIPTTLLAQVDSSIGGKTGVNLPDIKNAVGAFWQPKLVGIDTSLLLSLPEPEYTSGLGEVVKYALILEHGLLPFLRDNSGAIRGRDPAILAEVVRRCCHLKADIVRHDERETGGLRSILNYGHTFGHAIESVFGYGKWKHGHAVAAGMMAAAQVSVATGLAPPDLVEVHKSVLTALGVPHAFPAGCHAELIEAMRHDKKSENGNYRLVLLCGTGKAKLVSGIEVEIIMRAMRAAAQEDA